METPNNRSHVMRAIIARHLASVAIGNIPFMLATAVLVVLIALLAWPGRGGERHVYRAVVTGYGLGSKYNSAATIFVRLPDGSERSLRLSNSAGCRIGSTIGVTESSTLLGSNYETDLGGCH